jgi:hypothetical protein
VDRDIAFAKLFAQKATRGNTSVIALVASSLEPAGLVFAQTPPLSSSSGTALVPDMGALLKQVLGTVGGRGGGSRDFAQGGVPANPLINLDRLLREAAGTIEA